MRRDGRALRHASDELRNDLEVVIAAVRQDVHANSEYTYAGSPLKYASDELRNDGEAQQLIIRNVMPNSLHDRAIQLTTAAKKALHVQHGRRTGCGALHAD